MLDKRERQGGIVGEYWKPVNVTRGEYIHPHKLNNGLKLLEWWGYGSNVVRRRMREVWPDDDDIRAVSDYGGEEQLLGSPRGRCPNWDELDDLRDVSK